MNWKFWTRLSIVLLYFLSLLWLVVGVPDVFNSPDERANYVFSKEFATNFQLSLDESWNPEVLGVIHPRSVLAFENKLLPTSFLGLPIIYGLVAKFFGSWSIVFLTPFLAALMIVAWWQIIKKIFESEQLADLSTFFLVIHPAFWLYGARVMMHNVSFVAFLVFTAWFILVAKMGDAKKMFLAGVMLSLALAFRSSEILWVTVLALTGCYYLYRQKSWKMVTLFLATTVVFSGLFLLANKATFGGFLETGYTLSDPNYAFSFSQPVIDIQNAPSGIFGYLLPFGFHELAILRHVWWYGFSLFPWLSFASLIGLVLVVKDWRHKNDAWRWLAMITLVLSSWLAVVYGSWTFNDNPDPNLITLANSYVRYWLPLFILSTPFAAYGFLKVVDVFKKEKIKKLVLSFTVLCFLLLSLNLVFFGKDGLVETRKHLFEFREKREYILSSTESDAIIIVDRADKYLFPDRKVVVPLRSEQTYAAVPLLLEHAPLYYFGITLPEADIAFLADELLPGYNFELLLTVDEESLYKISYED